MRSRDCALFIALAVRGAGGAMAVWFLWIFPMEQLGDYNFASRKSKLGFNFLAGAVRAPLYPAFCAAKDDLVRLRSIFLRTTRAQLVFLMPLPLIMFWFVCSNDAES